nr:DUF1349 domain-containing protein [bacterium]
PYAMMAVTPANGFSFQHGFYQSSELAPYTFPNAWVKLVREGRVVTGYASANGETWTQVGTTALSTTEPIEVGLFITSHDGSVVGTTTIDSVTLNATAANPLPAEWNHLDIGAPKLPGNAIYNASTEQFTLDAAGNDIWADTDQFHYAYQELSGDGSITAQVISQSNTNDWAKAGVMIKDSATAMSPYAMMAVTPVNGYTFQHGFNQSSELAPVTLPNAWVRLTKVGNVVTGYVSSNGADWTQLSSAVLNTSTPKTIGLFNTSHNGNIVGRVVFENVVVEQTP